MEAPPSDPPRRTVVFTTPPVDATPAPPPTPATSPPPTTKPIAAKAKTPQIIKWLRWGSVVCVALMLAIVIPRAGVFLVDWWAAGRGVPPVVYALAHIVPTEECIRVTPDEVRNGTAAFGTVSLRNVRASLHHHMRYGTEATGPLHGIAAQYLERHRICFALVNLIYAPTEPDNLVEMYNLRVTGVSKSRVVRNTERSVLCKESYQARRFQEIVVEYITADGVRMEREVKGVAAQTIQQLDDVQSGRGYCKDTNLEAQLQKLHERIDGMEANGRAIPFAYPALADGRRT